MITGIDKSSKVNFWAKSALFTMVAPDVSVVELVHNWNLLSDFDKGKLLNFIEICLRSPLCMGLCAGFTIYKNMTP